MSWTRFETLIEAAIIAADPDTTAARETFAKATRSTDRGMRGFNIRADFATITRIDATVAYLAQVLLTLGDVTTLDQRRAKPVLILANPTQAVKILHAHHTWQHQPDTSTSTIPAAAPPAQRTRRRGCHRRPDQSGWSNCPTHYASP